MGNDKDNGSIGSTTEDDNEKKPTQTKGDKIQNIIGSWGRYQFFLCAIIFVSKIFIAYHQMAIIFLAPKVSYNCTGAGKDACPCDKPVYDTSTFTNSIIMKWDLICDKKYLVSLTQTIFQAGVLIGSMLFGMASDRFGRRKPLLAAVIMQILSGIGAAFMSNYWVFSALRFITGMSVGGTMVTGFVIIMEFVGTEYRQIISALYQVPFNIGHMLLPVNGYFFRDYFNFQLAISIPSVLMLSYFVLVPETPRWLIAVNQTDRAIRVLENVAKWNNRPTDNVRAEIAKYQEGIKDSATRKGTLLDLFRTPNLRKNIIAMSFNWFACSYCFYGVSQYVGQLSGNVFINVASSATVTMIGTFSSIPLMKYMGRKTIVEVFDCFCGFCLIILAMVGAGTLSVVLASSGVVAAFIVFVLVYLYCSELFPTVVRNAAIGYSSMLARVGSMIAPFVIDLKDSAAWLPPVIFAIPPLIAGSMTFLLLPETKGHELMTTLEEGENFGKKNPTSKIEINKT